MGKEPVESLWLMIKCRAGTGDMVVGVCYRPPKQEHQMGEVLSR